MFSAIFKRAFANLAKEEAPEQTRSRVRQYELTIIRFTPAPVPTTSTFSFGNAAADWLGIDLEHPSFLRWS